MDTKQDKAIAEVLAAAGNLLDACNTYFIQEPDDQLSSMDYARKQVRRMMRIVEEYERSDAPGGEEINASSRSNEYQYKYSDADNVRGVKMGLFELAQDLAELAYVLEEPLVGDEKGFVAVKLLSRIGVMHQMISLLLKRDPPTPPWE